MLTGRGHESDCRIDLTSLYHAAGVKLLLGFVPDLKPRNADGTRLQAS